MQQEIKSGPDFKRVVALAVDDSKHSAVALDCKFCHFISFFGSMLAIQLSPR